MKILNEKIFPKWLPDTNCSLWVKFLLLFKPLYRIEEDDCELSYKMLGDHIYLMDEQLPSFLNTRHKEVRKLGV